MRSPIPPRIARTYLESESVLALLVAANGLAVLVGFDFYLDQLQTHAANVVSWLVIADSPLAIVWLVLALYGVVAAGGVQRLRERDSLTVELVHALAFTSLLKYGLWTVFTLNYFFFDYYPDPYGYFTILVAHAAMAFEAFLVPYVGRTSKRALAAVAVWLFANDVLDYAFDYHPHLNSGTVGVLPVVTPLLTVVSVGLAWYCMDT